MNNGQRYIADQHPPMTPQTIVVLRALQLGDLLCAVPAFRSLRMAFPRARIALIGLPWAKLFVSRFAQYLDEFIEFPGYPGLPEQPIQLGAVPVFLTEMQRRRFDLALQMHGSGLYANQLITLLGANITAGFAQANEHCPDKRWFIPYPDHLPETERHLTLLRHLGVPTQDHRLEFPLNADDVTAYGTLQASYGLRPGTYVCVHPGGRGSTRRWAPHLFSAVADHMFELGYRVIITGTEEERQIAAVVRAHMRHKATDLVGQTDLGTLGVLLSHSALLIANDTGVSHMAAALQVPSVIICVGSDPIRWSPSDRLLHRVLIGQGTTVDDVIEALLALEPVLSRGHSERHTVPSREFLAPRISQVHQPLTESSPYTVRPL